ncbi:MAG: sorbosone dehydrogenase family protein [Salinirussus sp.]
MRRRRFLAACTVGLAGLAGCGAPGGRSGSAGSDEQSTATAAGGGTGSRTRTGDPSGDDPGGETEGTALPDSVGLVTVADGLQTPLDVAFAPQADRRYVAEQRGLVRVHGPDGLRSDPLLDLRDRVTTGFETGLLGIALHPDFAENRRLFVRYSAPRRPGTPTSFSHTFVLAEFRVAEDGLTAVDGTERTVLEIPEPQANHNAGAIVFGSEGYLYVGVGDGGAGGDRGRGHSEDWYDALPGGNGQDVSDNLLGSILRIDVDGREDGTGYAVPDDNPLVGREGLDEQYAWGFRNPWRLSVDGEDLYAGDVGQNRYEEIDLVERGGNYGWNVREGRHCFGADACPASVPAGVRDGRRLRPPVIEYPHSGAPVSGISVITGNVYRGSTVPALRGRFVFGDFRASGRLFVATPGGEGPWQTAVLPVRDRDASALDRVLSFGRDDGELYVLGTGDGRGGIYRLIPADA